MIKGFWIKAILFVVFTLSMTGCYWNDEVATNQMGAQLDKNEIQKVVGPGVYTDFGYYADLVTVNVDTLTFSVEDQEVLTSDNQSVGVKITIQARRKSDDDSIKNLLTRWNSLTDDGNLINTISATAREGMKVGTRKFTLPQLLDERSDNGEGKGLAGEIRKAIEEDSDKYGVELINVTVENIGPSAEYMTILSQIANLTAQTEQERRRQELINQKASNDILQQQKNVEVSQAQVLAEQAKTQVELEIATRKGKLIAAENQVFVDNPRAFELKKLELLQGILGKANVIYLPSDVVLNLLQGTLNGAPVVPVPAQ